MKSRSEGFLLYWTCCIESTFSIQFQILRKLSQDPVATAIPSSVTPRQLTRLSWPASTPVRTQRHYIRLRMCSRCMTNPLKLWEHFQNQTGVVFGNTSHAGMSNKPLTCLIKQSYCVLTGMKTCSSCFERDHTAKYLTGAVGLQGVPHVTVKVVVTGEQQTAALGEGHGGYAADDVVVGIHHELLVGTQVKQTAGGVIGARGESVAIREELSGRSVRKIMPWTQTQHVSVFYRWWYTHANGVDVRLVTGESLSAHAFTDVPEFSRSIAGPGHKQPGVWSQRETHDITGVSRKRGGLLTGLNVPESTAGHRETSQRLLRTANKDISGVGDRAVPSLTRWCHQNLLQSGCHQGSGSRRDIL